MHQQLVKEITDSLNDMEDKKAVDLSILDKLKNLRGFLLQLKTKWLEDKNTDGFYFYQAARNVELIVGKMEDRFVKAKEMHDNPQIALDSLKLMPIINGVMTLACTDHITAQSIDRILEESSNLRNVAASSHLIEPLEIDRDSISKDLLRQQFNALMDKLDIPEDQQDPVVSA